MSVYFFSGKPGSGKSLHAAKMIDEWICKGRNVITNFPINENFWDKRRAKGKKVGLVFYTTNEDIMKYGVKGLVGFSDQYHKRNSDGQMMEKQTLVIFDECQTMFNSRSWNAKGRSDWITLFSQHRKLGFEFLLISQDKTFVDKQIRAQFQWEHEHRNIKDFKSLGFILAMLCGGNFFVVIVRAMDIGKKDHAEFRGSSKKYYKLYDSYRIFDTKTLRANY